MDLYIYVIITLLPIAALMVVLQVNPYHALVIRGILGALAALIYTIMGAGDVGLTEALVGTLLSITLYAVAVRSSLVFRVGILEEDVLSAKELEAASMLNPFKRLTNDLRSVFRKRHLRVEVVTYADAEKLQQALDDKDVHAICTPAARLDAEYPYQMTTRIHYLYEVLQRELVTLPTHSSRVDLLPSQESQV